MGSSTGPVIHRGTSVPLPDRQIASMIDAHPRPRSVPSYSYGTAGFRYEASLLPCVFVRMGIFAALRSASLGGVSSNCAMFDLRLSLYRYLLSVI